MGELTNKDFAEPVAWRFTGGWASPKPGNEFDYHEGRGHVSGGQPLYTQPQQPEPNELSIVNSLLPDGWMLEYNKKPVPDRSHDWDFTHIDYDYCSETGSNGLSGTAGSPIDALQQIIRIESERKFSAEKEEIRRYCFSFMDFHFDYSGSNAFDDWWDQQGVEQDK